MARWLTLGETCTELRLGARAVKALIRSGQLVAIRLPRRGRVRNGALRILFPGPKLLRRIQESERHLEHVPLISGQEAAEVLGVTPGAVRQRKKRGQLRGSKVKNATLYTVTEIRNFLFQREESKRGGRRIYSPILVRWLRRLVEKDTWLDVQVLDELLRQAIAIPEPAKSTYIVEAWKHFDAINSLLHSARLGEHIIVAAKKASPPQVVGPKVQLGGAGMIDYLNRLRAERA